MRLKKIAKVMVLTVITVILIENSFVGLADETTDLANTSLNTVEQNISTVEKDVPLPVISAGSAVVIDGDTGKALYSKYSHVRRDPASTTKLLTVLIAVERLDLDEVVVVDKYSANTPGTTMGLKRGERVTVRDLLYGSLLPSGNDAAAALGRKIGGTMSNFSEIMNRRARQLGCKESSFSNSYGWKSSKHYSTAMDMSKIARAALSNETIAKISGVESYRVPKTNKQKSRRIWTTNSFIAKKVYTKCGVFAGKTGTWEWNNASLVSVARRKGKVLYAVVLHDTLSGRYKSTNSILNYGYKLVN